MWYRRSGIFSTMNRSFSSSFSACTAPARHEKAKMAPQARAEPCTDAKLPPHLLLPLLALLGRDRRRCGKRQLLAVPHKVL